MDIPPKMCPGILPYASAMLGLVVVMGYLKSGLRFWEGWQPQHVLAGLICIPLFSAVTWMRWIWGPYTARQRKKSDQPPGD